MYFFHYALDDNTIQQIKDEVDNAVVKSNYYVDDKVSDISTTKGKQYHLNDAGAIEYIPTALCKLNEIIYHALPVSNCVLKSAWTVYGEKGAFHTVHRHNDLADICTLVYLDVEKEELPHKHGAFFYFLDGECKTHHPMTGDVLIFPATMWHGTYPQSTDSRHTLNMDFSYEGNIYQ